MVNLLALLIISWLIGVQVYRRFVVKKLGQDIKGSPDLAVLITGCDTGFGFLSAVRLQKKGFFVFACCLSKESDGAKKLSSIKNIHVIQLDVCSDEDVARAQVEVHSVLNNNNEGKNGPKKLHAIVNNAGIATVGMIEWSKSMKDLQTVMDVNLYGVIRMTKAFLPLLRRSKGRIVNISSAAARDAAVALTAYGLSKAAVTKFSEFLDLELSSFGVKAITLEPFFFKTDIVNAEVSVKQLMKQWNEADDEIKTSYRGIDKLANSMKITNSPHITDSNPGKVVDLIEEAITSPDPDYFYRPGYKLPLMTLSLFLPYELLYPFRRNLAKLLARGH